MLRAEAVGATARGAGRLYPIVGLRPHARCFCQTAGTTEAPQIIGASGWSHHRASGVPIRPPLEPLSARITHAAMQQRAPPGALSQGATGPSRGFPFAIIWGQSRTTAAKRSATAISAAGTLPDDGGFLDMSALPEAALHAVLPEGLLYIDGKLRRAAGNKTYDNISPWTGKVIGRAADAAPADVEEAIAS